MDEIYKGYSKKESNNKSDDLIKIMMEGKKNIIEILEKIDKIKKALRKEKTYLQLIIKREHEEKKWEGKGINNKKVNNFFKEKNNNIIFFEEVIKSFKYILENRDILIKRLSENG